MSVTSKSLGAITALFLISGCVAIPRYTGYGKSQDEFMRDRYQCYQETQQRVSGAYVDKYGGAAGSRVIPSCSAFGACLAAKGYFLSKNGNLEVPSGAVIQCQP